MLFTAIGIFGVIINLIAYGLVTTGRLSSNDTRYQLINIVGTIGLLISLIPQPNRAVLILNVAWLLIGIIGLARILLLRRAA